MKTIKQICVSDLGVENEDPFIRIYQDGEYTCVERSKAVELAEALLPEGKAIIDVPQFDGYDYVRFGYYSRKDEQRGLYKYSYVEQADEFDINNWLDGQVKNVLIYRKIEIQEPFVWPEHLPDGKTEIRKIDGEWHFGSSPAEKMIPLAYYNTFARPDDRMEIPEWLEREPRTIVKGEG